MRQETTLLEAPAYGLVEAAQYLRMHKNTLTYWLVGGSYPLFKLACKKPPRLSFMNLLECHVLNAMKSVHGLKVAKVRRAVKTLNNLYPSHHPLIDRALKTDRKDVFLDEFDELINLSRDGQKPLMREMIELHLERIERDQHGLFRLFPFVVEKKHDEPKFIEIYPSVGFGRPVIAGTGISTSIIASRFKARESIPELAEEYGRTEQEIQEAILWETGAVAA